MAGRRRSRFANGADQSGRPARFRRLRRGRRVPGDDRRLRHGWSAAAGASGLLDRTVRGRRRGRHGRQPVRRPRRPGRRQALALWNAGLYRHHPALHHCGLDRQRAGVRGRAAPGRPAALFPTRADRHGGDDGPQLPGPAQAARDPCLAGRSARRPRFLDRLPPQVCAAPSSARSRREDHYLRLRTSKGRGPDPAAPGGRRRRAGGASKAPEIHRSWWVAKAAVERRQTQ
jgi:hypothetical protein